VSDWERVVAPNTPNRIGRWAALMGGVAGLAVLATLGDPGITSDEPIDVRVGRRYVTLAQSYAERASRLGLDAIDRSRLDAMFADNHQHPPLGRWAVGIASTVAEPFEGLLGGTDPESVHAARIAPMLAFALLVGLVTFEAGRRYGRTAGLVSGASLVLMPRVFAHAHFATLDTMLALTWTAALFGAARSIESRKPVRGAFGAGLLWGLALLTKIHAWLMPPLVIGYALGKLPFRRALAASAVWMIVGLATFLAGWPWLWFDTVARLRGFLSTSVDRLPLRVLYFGEVVPDVAVPWHYPWVYFVLTVPVGLQLLGALGTIQGARRVRLDLFPLLLVASIGLFLGLFSTSAPVYDGERLFAHVFPAWAVLIGLGFRALWEWRRSPVFRSALILALLAQGYGLWRLHPFQLSYYNAVIGGLPGAERLGLELTYWGDTIDRRILEDTARLVAEDGAIALAPTLHHLQPTAILNRSLFERGIAVRPHEALDSADALLVYRRSAYWTEEVRDWIDRGKPAAQRSRQGVWLTRLYLRDDLPPPETSAPEFSSDNSENTFRTN